MPSETYAALTKPFDQTFTDPRGFTYISGEQCVTRLNTVLGPGGWSFAIVDKGINAEADEAWVLGHLTATIDGADVHREQFGSQKIARKRDSGTPLDIGFTYKGAGTDALKKCASLIGVGLYLSEHDEKQPQGRPAFRPTYSNKPNG